MNKMHHYVKLPQRVATYSAAVDMMKARLALLLKYLDAVIAGQIQNDPAITRHVWRVCCAWLTVR